MKNFPLKVLFVESILKFRRHCNRFIFAINLLNTFFNYIIVDYRRFHPFDTHTLNLIVTIIQFDLNLLSFKLTMHEGPEIAVLNVGNKYHSHIWNTQVKWNSRTKHQIVSFIIAKCVWESEREREKQLKESNTKECHELVGERKI